MRRLSRRVAIASVVLCLAPAAVRAQNPMDALRVRLEERIARHHGNVGVAVIDLKSGETLTIGDREFPTASVIKVPILVELFQQVEHGPLRLEDPITLIEADKVPGAGVLQFLSTPHQITVADAATLMIILSDNTATNLLIDKLGIRSVNMRMDSLGLKRTKLFAEVFRRSTTNVDPVGAETWGLGVTTPLELARLFEMIYRGTAVSPDASRRMVEILKKQFSSDRLPRYLTGVEIAHKTGEIDESRHDCGIVYGKGGKDYVLCIMTDENQDRSWRLENEAILLGADLSRIVYEGLVGKI